MRQLIPILLCATALLRCQNYPLGPDSQPKEGVPKGIVTKFTLPPGKYYPGAPHNCSLYVPAQYDASKPTPFMIFLDGSGALGAGVRVPVVFDNLIAKKEIPPMIGVFIDPGVLPMANDQQQNRFERIFEYDNISDRFSRFLIEELIPEVARNYNLSTDPNDRGLSGVSTGAVGAFMAAWHRPDQFRRVLSFIGTYVAMKGADSLPALIRRTEPKPIRIFLQAGKNDHLAPGIPFGVFYAGSWPINNQVMYEAFEFAGYDVKFELGEEAHNMRHGGAIMPDALRWLWRDYPNPIVVHEPASMKLQGWEPRGQVYSLISADKPWEQVGETYKAAASPAANKDGAVFFTDGTRILKSDADKKVSVFKDAAPTKALRFGPDGRLYASQPARKRIVSYGPAGDEKVVAQPVEASDLALTAKNEIYYTDLAHKTVGYIDTKGRKRIVYDGGEIAAPTALGLTPDQSVLIVGDGQLRFSWSFQLGPDGSLINGEPFFRLELPETSPASGVEAVATDTGGWVYFADAVGIQVCEPIGRCAQILNKPEFNAPVTSLAFGGKDLNWLYVTQGGKLFRRPVKRNGSAAWAIVKPPRPPL